MDFTDITEKWRTKRREMRAEQDYENGQTPLRTSGLTANIRQQLENQPDKVVARLLFTSIISCDFTDALREVSLEKINLVVPNADAIRDNDELGMDIDAQLEEVNVDYEGVDEDEEEQEDEEIEPLLGGHRQAAAAPLDDENAPYADNHPNPRLEIDAEEGVALQNERQIRAILSERSTFRDECLKYAATYFFDCLQPTQQLEDQWSALESIRASEAPSPVVRHVMSRQAFRDFGAVLTLGPLARTREKIVHCFNEGINNTYVPHGAVAIDGAGCPHSGQGPCVFNRKNLNPFFIKIHVIADSNDVACWILPHFDLNEKISTLKLAELAHNYLLRCQLTHSAIVCNSWYGNIPVAQYYQRHNRRFCMSLENMSSNKIIQILTSNLDDLEAKCIQSKLPGRRTLTNPITITAFRDARHTTKRKPVIIISNTSKSEFSVRKGKPKPNSVHFYAQNMGYVDHVDQAVLQVLSKRGYRCWKRKIIHYLFVLAAQNAWRWFQLFRGRKIQFVDFLDILAWELLGEEKEGEVKAKIWLGESLPFKICVVQKLDNEYSNCAHCRKSETPYICGCQNAPVHPDCWNGWHERHQNRIQEQLIPARRPGMTTRILNALWNWLAALNMLILFIHIPIWNGMR